MRVVVHLGAGLREFLQGAALAERVVRIPLPRPPPRNLHVLEVHLPDGEPPLVLLATSAGPPASSGYPLRLAVPAPPQAHPHLGRSLASGKLRIEAFIADGAGGLVYRARHRALHVDVAVKVLDDSYRDDPDFAQRFQAEALSTSSLDHPSLMRVLDFGQEEDGLLYLAMEYLDGKTLREVLVQEHRLAPERAMSFVIQVCAALAHAHGRGIVHRDIKPENVVVVRGVDDDGLDAEMIKVCNFAIAHHSAEAADPESDVYACGVLLHELLTGRLPVVDHDLTSGVDPRLDEILAKALAPAKADRFRTTRALRRALLDLTNDDAPDSRVPESPVSSSRIPEAPISALAVPVPPAPRSSRPEWLEVGRGFDEGFAAASERAPRSAPLAKLTLVKAPAGATATLVRQLVDTVDPEQFAELARPIEARARELASQGDTDALFRIHGALAMIAAEHGKRARPAAKILHVFGDLTFLAPIADLALDAASKKDRTAAKLLARAGTTGAYALYAARRKSAAREARERFVAALAEIGPNALPVINAGLERMVTRLSIPGAIEIAEDLLRAVPETDSPITAELVCRFAGVEILSIVEIAAKALASMRGPRARITLIALGKHPEPRVRLAAGLALERRST